LDVNQYWHELLAFLTDTLTTGGYSVVVTIERSGERLYEEAQKAGVGPNVLHVPFRGLHAVHVTGKKVLVFDDAIDRGDHMERVVQELRRRGAIVETAVFAKKEGSHYNVTHHRLALDIQSYKALSSVVSHLLDSLDRPVDTDHLYLRGHLVDRSGNTLTYDGIRETLEPLGEIYEAEEPSEGLRKFGLRDFEFLRLDMLNLPKFVTTADTWKIRFYVHPDGKLSILPLVFVQIVPRKDSRPCDDTSPARFCELYPSNAWINSHEKADWLLCVYCVIYFCTVELLRSFLTAWKRILDEAEVAITVENISYEDAEYIFHDPSLVTKVWEVVNGVINPPQGMKVSGKRVPQ
jgi:hypothetical protein